MTRPLSFTFLGGIAGTFATIVLAFLAFGTYTKRSTVAGQLLPASGVVKVYAQQFGIVLERRVAEGQAVKQGDVLYVLSSDRQSTHGATQAAISGQVEARQRSLRDERDKTRRLQRDDVEAVTKKISALQSEAGKLDNQIDGQKQRVKLAEEAYARYQDLVARGFVSSETLQQKQADMLDQRLRLQNLERDRIVIARDLTALQDELASLPLKHQNQLAQLDRSLALTGQELSESEVRRRLVITAPQDGTATAVVADIGQTVDANKPLATLVPAGSALQAHLYAPSRAIGFIRSGDPVLLRYQAYPYQKFGHVQGTVASVARTALSSAEITNLGTPTQGGNSTGGEPLYRITVDLAAQTIQAYGKPQALQAGMLLDADILQETRRLYEWVLEPLYSLTGKL